MAFVSQKRVLGGWLSGEVLQPLVDLDVQLANGTSSRVRGLADLPGPNADLANSSNSKVPQSLRMFIGG